MAECCQWLSTTYTVMKREVRSVRKEIAISSLHVKSYQRDLLVLLCFSRSGIAITSNAQSSCC